MLKITDINYERYKKVLEVIWTFVVRDAPSLGEPASSPVAVLEHWEKENTSRAKKGLKQGLLDLLAGLKTGMQENDKLLLNKKLVQEGLPGLWELMSAINNIPAKVLKRGKINNLDEWYVITELLSAIDSPVTQEERIKLGELSSDFEYRQKRMGR